MFLGVIRAAINNFSILCLELNASFSSISQSKEFFSASVRHSQLVRSTTRTALQISFFVSVFPKKCKITNG